MKFVSVAILVIFSLFSVVVGDYWQDRFDYVHNGVNCYQNVIGEMVTGTELQQKWDISLSEFRELYDDFSEYFSEFTRHSLTTQEIMYHKIIIAYKDMTNKIFDEFFEDFEKEHNSDHLRLKEALKMRCNYVR